MKKSPNSSSRKNGINTPNRSSLLLPTVKSPLAHSSSSASLCTLQSTASLDDINERIVGWGRNGNAVSDNISLLSSSFSSSIFSPSIERNDPSNRVGHTVFAATVPINRKERLDVFGVSEKLLENAKPSHLSNSASGVEGGSINTSKYSVFDCKDDDDSSSLISGGNGGSSLSSYRKMLRTPPEQRKRINEMKQIKTNLISTRVKYTNNIIAGIKATTDGTKAAAGFIRHYSTLKKEYLLQEMEKKRHNEGEALFNQQLHDQLRKLKEKNAAMHNMDANHVISIDASDLTTDNKDVRHQHRRNSDSSQMVSVAGDDDHSIISVISQNSGDDDDSISLYSSKGADMVNEVAIEDTTAKQANDSVHVNNGNNYHHHHHHHMSSIELREVFERYFGIPAREEFFTLFKKAHNDYYVTSNQIISPIKHTKVTTDGCDSISHYEENEAIELHNRIVVSDLVSKQGYIDDRETSGDDDKKVLQLTPHKLFLKEQHMSNLPPLPLILRDLKNPKSIYLSHRGLGDERIAPLIKMIDTLPSIEQIDIADNRLTDASLIPLMMKLRKLRYLTHLDLSFNDMDESCDYIRKFIITDVCKLRSLLLNGSDIDDMECGLLVDALKINTTIQKLCLAKNKIGDAELLNVVMPDIVTGGESLAQLLLDNKTISVLDVSWNAIRLGSGEQMGAAMEHNIGLTELNLSYNNFGDTGCQLLGRSMKYNKHLKKLNISYNSMTPKAACVLSNSLLFNTSLNLLNVDGNVLGRVGSCALVAAVQRANASSLGISFKACDCDKEDPSLFDPSSPGGCYTLSLDDPYDSMVVDEIFYLANNRAGCSITLLEYNKATVPLDRNENQLTKKSKFTLSDYLTYSDTVATHLNSNRVAEASRCLDKLLKMFGFIMHDDTRIKVLTQVHTQYSAKNGRKKELKNVILFEVFIALFHINDSDASGTMELNEFEDALRSLGRTDIDTKSLHQLMSYHDTDESGTIDSEEFGLIMVNDFCKTQQPRGAVIEKSTGIPWSVPREGKVKLVVKYECELPTVFDVSADTGHESIINAIHAAKTDDQKLTIFDNAIKSPYYYFSAYQAQLLYDATKSLTVSKLNVIASILPQIVNPAECLLFIDKNLDDDGKLALRILIGPIYNIYVSNATGHYLLDLSSYTQLVGGKKLSAQSVTERHYMASVGCKTSQKGNGENFRNEMLTVNSHNQLLDVTGDWFTACTSKGLLRCDFVSTTRPREGTRPLSTARFDQLVNKLKLCDVSQYIEQHKSKEYSDTKTKQPLDYTLIVAPLTVIHIKQYFFEYIESCHYYHSIYPEERVIMHDSQHAPGAAVSRALTPYELNYGDLEKPDRTYMNPAFALMYKKLLMIQIHVISVHLSIDQVIELMSYFPNLYGCVYIRVQILQSVWSKIIDLHNVYKIMDNVFNEGERNEALHRLGILNIYDPLTIDRSYALDLRRYDHREFSKVLILLAANEPGDNYINAQFRWTKYDSAIPGWVIPTTWSSSDESSNGEGGPRRYGWFSVTYTSTGNGCMPNIAARKDVRKRFLASIKRIL